MKILVIYATAGAGHKKAAEAIFDGLVRQAKHEVVLVDALDHTPGFFKKFYPAVYTLLVTRLPWVWGILFAWMDLPWMQGVLRSLRRCYNSVNTRPLVRFLKQEQFDGIITTQFLSAEVAASLKRRSQIKSRVICVVTDFDVHRIWVNEGVDCYAVACDDTKEKLVSLGVGPSRVFVTGIPVNAKFIPSLEAASLKAKWGLESQRLTILIVTGSFGMGPIESLVKMLEGYQLLIVCGSNRFLYERLSVLGKAHVHVFRLVDNMHELMSMADVMITKPGGLSIAEALVKRLPLLFFSVIPGQEANNIKVLKKYGISSGLCSLPQIVDCIRDWDAHREKLDCLRQRSEALAKPHAVADIMGLL